MRLYLFAESAGFEDNKYSSLDYKQLPIIYQPFRRLMMHIHRCSKDGSNKNDYNYCLQQVQVKMSCIQRFCHWLCGADEDTIKEHEADSNLNKINQLYKERDQLRSELQSSKKKMEMLQGQASKRRPDSLHQQSNSFRQQQLVRNTSETNRLLSAIDDQKNRLLSYQQTMEKLQRDNNSMNSQLKKNYQIISSLQAKNRQLTRENERLKKQNESYKAKLDANRNSQNSESMPGYLVHRATKFFSGDVLDQFDDFKIYLTDTLEKETGLTIKRTQLLFRYEKAFPRNLHLPIDGHSPLVLLLKTVKGYHLACVSEAPFAPNSSKQGRGWLISLTKGRVYRSVPGKQAILYDQMYLIFGNQELRIDGSSNKVFSNFGIGNSFYNTTGNDVRDFLGPGLDGTPREAELESYEIFKLIAE